MGLDAPSHVIGFDGTIDGGPNHGHQVRVVAGLRNDGGSLAILNDERGEERLIAIDAGASVDAVVEGGVSWPPGEVRARQTAMAIRRWFLHGSALLEEPFAGAKLNAHPVHLVGCSVDDDVVVAEFTETWDVQLIDVRVLDVDATWLAVLADHAVLTSRHPGEAPSVSQLRRIPFRWRRAG